MPSKFSRGFAYSDLESNIMATEIWINAVYRVNSDFILVG